MPLLSLICYNGTWQALIDNCHDLIGPPTQSDEFSRIKVQDVVTNSTAENFPPQQAPQICLPAQPVFEQASFMWEEHCYE